ncbi:hypothetical protein IX51_09185 [uncultured archaeon]|nr:hypothetical protein IX51_09185 [uncultured archaeon]
MKFRSASTGSINRIPVTITVSITAMLCLVLVFSFAVVHYQGNKTAPIASTYSLSNSNSYYYQGYYYNTSAAVNYAEMVHKGYFHNINYPAGINQSIMQNNMDYFNSEDCAHFVSEALIAGGLTALASNPPGDNLSTYQSGFPGSYGIVGVYRLADYLAGYDLPVFPNNATQEKIMMYQPIPGFNGTSGNYTGSPHASVFYVTNDSILPQYIISPGDVIADGGVGNGHAMLYIGNGQVVQTDPAAIWTYYPGTDQNISFFGMLTLHGKNVSAIYIHMPTISSQKTVHITGLAGSEVLNKTHVSVSKAADIKLISSYPDGVGFGNYSYTWYLNGKEVSSSQITDVAVSDGNNNIELKAAGSNGTAYYNMTIYVGSQGLNILGLGQPTSIAVMAVPVAAVAGGSSYYYMKKRRP